MTGSRPVLAVTSPGLWAQRREIETVLDADIRFFPAVLPFAVDGFVGWGGRASGLRARRLARRFGKLLIEFRHMPVTEAGKVVGLLSYRDIPAEYVMLYERFREMRASRADDGV